MNFKMNMRFTIGKKVALGYILIILITTVSSIYTLLELRRSRETDRAVTETYMNMLVKMDQLKNMLEQSRKLTNNWVYNPNDDEKRQLIAIHDTDFPGLTEAIDALRGQWIGNVPLDTLDMILADFSKNIEVQKQVSNLLVTSEDYANDSIVFFVAIPLLDDKVDPQIKNAADRLEAFTLDLQSESDNMIAEKNASLDALENLSVILIIVSIVCASLASFFIARGIVVPVTHLNKVIQKMSLGELPELDVKVSRDEVGDMLNSMKELRDGLENTANFALKVGQGHLDINYEVLSRNDVLGKALVAMRNNLKQVVEETNIVVKNAGEEGDLNSRIDTHGKEGAWQELSNSINDLLISISRPVLIVRDMVDAMANGDLTQRYRENAKGDIHSLTSSLNSALENLNGFLNIISENALVVQESSVEMLTASGEMTSSTVEIASSIEEMSHGSRSQVAKVDESSSLVEGILNSSKEMKGRAEKINVAANAGVDSSDKGSKLVSNVEERMNEISSFSDHTITSIEVLAKRSEEINRMLTVISDIASQTNLLSLNAAIEAAQAGDAGRGFAVVAEEIRKLAESSRKSTKEIEELVSGVQNDIDSTVKAIKSMHESVKEGERASKQVSESFSEISDSSHNTLVYSKEILESSDTQMKDINEVFSITESIVIIAEQTASGTEEIASSSSQLSTGMVNYKKKSEQLSQVAMRLKDGLSKFELSSENDDDGEFADDELDVVPLQVI